MHFYIVMMSTVAVDLLAAGIVVGLDVEEAEIKRWSMGSSVDTDNRTGVLFIPNLNIGGDCNMKYFIVNHKK